MTLFRVLSGFLLFTFSLLAIISLQQKQVEVITENINPNYKQKEDKEKVVLELQKKMPRLGFKNLWADWNYLQFIQYFGDTPARNETGYTLVPEYFELIVKDDPRFIEALFTLSTANSLYAVSPVTTVKLLNQVVGKIRPEDNLLSPYLWSYKGVDEMLFLGDSQGAQRSYEIAAEWALRTNAPDKEAVAQRNRETAQYLATNPESKKARVAAWMFILRGGINEETQKLAIREIRALGGKVSLTEEGRLEIEFPEED